MEWSQFAIVNVFILARRVFTKSSTFGSKDQPRFCNDRSSISQGEFPYKRTGVLVGNFENPKTPKRYQDPVLWAWLENLFTSKTNSKSNN